MEYNLKLLNLILLFLICDLTVFIQDCTDLTLDFTPFRYSTWYQNVQPSVGCHYGYYHCYGYKWCCPNGYKCSCYSDCYSRTYRSSGSSNVGAIVGGCIGGLVGLVFLCGCMSVCCSKLSDKCCTGKVESINTQPNGQNTTTDTEIRQQTGTRIETNHPTKMHMGPSIPGAFDPAYPPPSYHL